MRLVIATVGRFKESAERELFGKYHSRFEASAKRLGLGPVDCIELVESRAQQVSRRCAEEGEALLKVVREATFVIALDVRGQALSSEDFARRLAGIRDDGVKTLAIVIGGPDGLSPEVLKAAKLKLSLGAMTLPHGLARIVLAEQLYRAATILSGHPYHRG